MCVYLPWFYLNLVKGIEKTIDLLCGFSIYFPFLRVFWNNSTFIVKILWILIYQYNCLSRWINLWLPGNGHFKHDFFFVFQVCSNCRLRSSCESGYLLTNKEDEAWTIDLMRVLLAYGFDSINGSVANTSKYVFFYSMLIYLYT